MESILTSIKKLLGIQEVDENFDQDIIMHINSVLSVLTQLGIGPKDGLTIIDKTAAWSDFQTEGISTAELQCIKSYVYLKVKLLFDPPLSASVIQLIRMEAAELEWRLMAIADPIIQEEEETDGV